MLDKTRINGNLMSREFVNAEFIRQVNSIHNKLPGIMTKKEEKSNIIESSSRSLIEWHRIYMKRINHFFEQKETEYVKRVFEYVPSPGFNDFLEKNGIYFVYQLIDRWKSFDSLEGVKPTLKGKLKKIFAEHSIDIDDVFISQEEKYLYDLYLLGPLLFKETMERNFTMILKIL